MYFVCNLLCVCLILAVLKQPWQSRNAALNYLTEETLAFAMGRAVDQSTKVLHCQELCSNPLIKINV